MAQPVFQPAPVFMPEPQPMIMPQQPVRPAPPQQPAQLQGMYDNYGNLVVDNPFVQVHDDKGDGEWEEVETEKLPYQVNFADDQPQTPRQGENIPPGTQGAVPGTQMPFNGGRPSPAQQQKPQTAPLN